MQSCNLNINGTIMGVQFSGGLTRSHSGGGLWTPNLPAAYLGTAWSKATATTGTYTLPAGHGINTADIVDVFWPGGSALGVTVGTIAGNSCPLSGGVLPNGPGAGGTVSYPNSDGTNTIGMTLVKTTVLSAGIGTALAVLALAGSYRFGIELRSVTPTLLFSADIAAGEFYNWAELTAIATSPLGGTANATIRLGNANSAAINPVNIAALYEA